MVDPTDKGARRLGPLRKALPGRKVDLEGELLSVPLPLNFIWLVLGVLTVLEALNDLFGVAGPDWLYDNWIHQLILGSARRSSSHAPPSSRWRARPGWPLG